MKALCLRSASSRKWLRQGNHRTRITPCTLAPCLPFLKLQVRFTLILPMIQGRLKEWAYAGFTFNFISAAVSNAVVYGFGLEPMIPAYCAWRSWRYLIPAIVKDSTDTSGKE